MAFVSLMALGMSQAAAQSELAARGDRPDQRTEQTEEITADEEITVVGQRSLRDLRLEVQSARERVYNLFNSLNIDDEFDIHCHDAPRTGTRIPQRVCRPQFADHATSHAGKELLLALFFDCGGGLCEAGLANGNARAQDALSDVSVKDQQLAAEVQRLARENPEFRRAILGYDAAERRYEDARGTEGAAWRVSASIIDTVDVPMASSLARQDGIVAPEAIELGTPEAPWMEAGAGTRREGWVKLRYSVLADGTTADVRAVDAMPPGLDASEAIAAAQTWTFGPATEDGVPIDWHNNLAVIVINRTQTAHEGSLQFAEAYEDVADLISRARYERAKSRNERMQRELAVTLDEMAFAEMQLAAIEHAMGDPQAAFEAIRRATEPAVHQLDDEDLKLALEHRFALELELGLAVDALKTYERRVELGHLASRDRMARLGETLEQALDAPETSLAAKGRIDGDGHWEHALTWRTFAVGDVVGRTDGLEVECNRNKDEPPFETDVEMTIPRGWGECVLFVKGQPDTTFVVYEFREPVH